MQRVPQPIGQTPHPTRNVISIPGYRRSPKTQVRLFTTLNWTLLAVDALIGVVIVLVRWRHAASSHRPLEEGVI